MMALSQGYQVAHAETHIAELKKTFRDVPLSPDSTRALLKLIELQEALNEKIAAGEVHLAVPERAAPPVKAAPPPPPPPPPEPEPVPEPEPIKETLPAPEPEVLAAIEDKIDGDAALAVEALGEAPIPLEEVKKMLEDAPEPQPETLPEPPVDAPAPEAPKGKKGKKS
jgi:hypothetical protein